MEKHREKNDVITKKGSAIAYCAGYFEQQKRRYSHGVIMIDDKQQEHEICGSGMNEKYLESQNLAGEIFGVLNAMDWAVSNGFSKLMIYCQNEQLAKWLTGEEKAESRAAKMLSIIFTTKYAALLQITVQHQKIQSENLGKAVELANKALTEGKRIPVSGDHWFVVDAVDLEKTKSLIKSLKNEIETLEIEEIDDSSKLCYKLTLAADQLAVTLFKSTQQSLLVRGKDSILFQVFVTHLNENADIKIEKVLSDAYRKRIDPLVLDQQVAAFFSTLPADFTKTTVAFIRQSVINLTCFIGGEEALQYVLPSMVAMETWLKANLSKDEADKAVEEYFSRVLRYQGPLRESRKLFHALITSKGLAAKVITTKAEADTMIRNTLFDLNSCAMIAKLDTP